MQDFKAGATADFKFTTITGTGAPSNLSGGACSVYKDNSTTETTAGVTLSGSPFDSLVGLNNLRVVMTDGFYAAGSSFAAVLTAGTVDGVSVAGYVVQQWTIGRDLHPNASGYVDATMKQIVVTSLVGDGSATPWGPA